MHSQATYSTKEARLLHDNYRRLLEILDSYSRQINLDPGTRQEVERILTEAFTKMKAQHFLNSKLSELSSYITESLCQALNTSEVENNCHDVIYVKKTKNTINHERFTFHHEPRI